MWSIYNTTLSADYNTLPSSSLHNNQAEGYEGYTFLEVQCKNFQVLQFAFHKEKSATACYDVLQKLCFGQSQLACFAFSNLQFPTRKYGNGWDIFSWEEEYKRLQLDPTEWRITNANANYELCKSYPSQFIVPTEISDDGKFYFFNRKK